MAVSMAASRGNFPFMTESSLKCEFRANGASPKFYPVRLFPNNLTEHDDGLAHAVDNTLPCGL
ncbi:hypothetical protein, partial [Candidatus Accumulibacter phosphatis]|uniref:hypothetical protein n=1 Tax=Candidatus Accumulibacter phosphatis TaxID=327160 RepID=UPI001BB275B4